MDQVRLERHSKLALRSVRLPTLPLPRGSSSPLSHHLPTRCHLAKQITASVLWAEYCVSTLSRGRHVFVTTTLCLLCPAPAHPRGTLRNAGYAELRLVTSADLIVTFGRANVRLELMEDDCQWLQVSAYGTEHLQPASSYASLLYSAERTVLSSYHVFRMSLVGSKHTMVFSPQKLISSQGDIGYRPASTPHCTLSSSPCV